MRCTPQGALGPGIALGRGSATGHAARILLDLVWDKLWALTFDFQQYLDTVVPVSTSGPGAIFHLTRSKRAAHRCSRFQLHFHSVLGDGSLQGDITVPRGHPRAHSGGQVNACRMNVSSLSCQTGGWVHGLPFGLVCPLTDLGGSEMLENDSCCFQGLSCWAKPKCSCLCGL